MLITPMLKNDLSTFESVSEFTGSDSFVENIGDTLPPSVISKDVLTYEIININQGILEINSHYVTVDIIDGEKIYENTNTYFVDSTTRKHVTDDELYFIFPTDVQKQNYFLLDPHMEVPAIFVFEGVKQIEDLEVYEFSCENMGADFSDAWPEFAPNVVYGDQTCKTSIEPITGKTMEFLITWDMYVIQDGEHISVELGSAETTDFTELILFQTAKNTIQLFYVYDSIVPIFLILFFTAIIFAGLFNLRTREKEKIILRQYEKLHEINKSKIDLLEKQKKQEKLSTIGELSARLAHDLRNPLSVLQVTLDNLVMKKHDQVEIEKSILRCNSAIDRMTHQINDVMDFVRHTPIELKNCSFLELLNKSIDSIIVPNSVNLSLPKDDFTINCDPEKIRIVFSNLILNGIQAIDGNGQISISVSNFKELVKITFSDSGKSISEDNLSKIFEPLFTTKQKGTGLGLASCKTIIENHGGTIQAKNNPKRFEIVLPKVHKK